MYRNKNKKIKNYYKKIENYDWVKAVDYFIGPETILHRTREKEILKLITQFGKEKFIDIGCGTGLILRHLPEESVGIDLNPRNLEKAKNYAPRAKFYLADIEEKFPFPDNYFNTAICTEVFEHLLFPKKALIEIRRILTSGGFLLGSLPSKSWLWKLRKLSFSKNYFIKEPYHKHRNKKEVIKLFSPILK